jgi:molybdenum cofactor biosynthesis protein B
MDSVEEHRGYAPASLRVVVLTASDSRRTADDTSGALIAEMAVAAGHELVDRTITPDAVESISRAVMQAIEDLAADCIVISGGTGFSDRDVSIEAVLPLFDRVVDGFGELFRILSYDQVGPAAMLSRATAGIIGRSVVFVVPGSPKAVELAMASLILPEVSHLVGQLRR